MTIAMPEVDAVNRARLVSLAERFTNAVVSDAAKSTQMTEILHRAKPGNAGDNTRA